MTKIENKPPETITERIIRETNAKWLEHYRGYDIYDQEGAIAVVHKVEDTIYVVGLDDSKASGKRTFVEAANNVESAKQYINHTVAHRVTSAFNQALKERAELEALEGDQYWVRRSGFEAKLRELLRMDLSVLNREQLLQLCAMGSTYRPLALHTFLNILAQYANF